MIGIEERGEGHVQTRGTRCSIKVTKEGKGSRGMDVTHVCDLRQQLIKTSARFWGGGLAIPSHSSYLDLMER